jgi:hypothetical protein
MSRTYYGYVYHRGRYDTPEVLVGESDLYRFLRDHLYDEEVRITDAGDRLLFHAVDGVDVYSRLQELDIDLPSLYREFQEEMVVDAPEVIDPASVRELGHGAEGKDEDWEEPDRRPGWERYYDTIGLSLGEILMRQAAKRACREAETVRDVALLLRGTYFDAFFESDDGSRAWGYFHGLDWWATVMRRTEDGGWTGDSGLQVELQPGARVRYVSSGEDVHHFVLVDTPDGP